MTTPLKLGQPRFLSKSEVLTLHAASLDAYGGADGFLNEGALDSALALPMQGFGGVFAHQFPFEMAAAYGYHIALNHAFRDGNKRTAFAAMVAFLRMNGWDFARPDESAARLLLDLIEQRHSKAWLAEQLAGESRPRISLELRDFFALVTGKRMTEAVQATIAVPKGPEFDATFEEASRTLPLLRDLHGRALVAKLASDEIGLARVGAEMSLLMHLYRIAEDMGYEW